MKSSQRWIPFEIIEAKLFPCYTQQGQITCLGRKSTAIVVESVIKLNCACYTFIVVITGVSCKTRDTNNFYSGGIFLIMQITGMQITKKVYHLYNL